MDRKDIWVEGKLEKNIAREARHMTPSRRVLTTTTRN